MKTIIVDSDDDKFMAQVIKFCKAVDKYRVLLGLNVEEVDKLKGDVNIVVYIATRYPSFTPSFIQYNIDTMRNRFEDICIACTSSKNYNHDIGLELGLETRAGKKHFFSDTLHKLFAGTLYADPHFQ
jgi:hypothetical protein